MDSNFSGNPEKKGSDQGQSEKRSVLVLHNDDINTFDYVMEALEEVCSHTTIQAEQCAMITHYNGRCEILNDEFNKLRPVRQQLTDRGLKATIE
mgnify:CR=1 FL=1